MKNLFPISYEKSLLAALVIYIGAAIIAGLIIWLAGFLTGWIPVAGVIIGPYDLSIMCSAPFNFEGELFLDCVKRTIEISRTHGKSVGMFMDDLDVAKKWANSGMNIFWTAPEAVALQTGLRAFTDGIAAL